EILQQFLAPDGDGAVQTRVTDEGTILYRFDTSFGPGAGLVGGTLDVFSLEDGDPAEDNSDPAAAGTGFLSNFSFTITESTASITLPVSDDLAQEVDQTFTYTLAEGEGYVVDPTANSGTFTVTDGVVPATSPTVGVTATPTTLIEAEQTVVELTFTTDGDIPEGGLVVQLQGPPRAIAEFDVNATNPRLPEDETVIEGVVVTGGNIVGTDEVAGSLFLRITDPTATVTVPVFDDGPGEGTEILDFALIDGEAYEIDPAASEVTVTIEDGEVLLPVVSATTSTPELTEDEQPQLEITLSVEGEIPDDGQGVVVTIGGDGVEKLFAPRLLDERTPPVFDPADGVVPISFTGTEVTLGLLVPEVTVTAGLFDDLVEEERDVLNFEILPSDGYNIGTGTVSIGIEDGPSATPGEGPTVSLSVTETELVEGDEFTVNISVDESTGAIPDGGLELFIDSGPTDVGEFVIFGEDGIDPATDLVGIDDFPLQGDRNGGFFVTVVEPEASITLSVFDDGPNEGTETLEFSLADGEIYEVDPDAQNVTVTIADGGEDAEYSFESGVTSVFLDFELLEQVAGITLVGADSDAVPEPRPGFLPPFQVGFEITEETDFSFAPVGFVPSGGSIEHDGTITLGVGSAEVTAGEFSIGFDPARASDVASGFFVADTLDDALGLEVLFDLGIPATAAVSGIDGDDLNLGDADLLLAPEVAAALGNADLAGADVGDARVDAIVSVVDDGGASDPVVSFSTTSGTLSEVDGPALVLNFTVDGEIPEGGITVNLEGDTAEILQQFLAPDGDGAVQTRVTDEGTILYRFDTSFGPGAGLEGGTLDVFSLEDGDPAEDNSDPAAAGTGFLSNFSFTITESTASITLPVSDDLAQEVDQTFTYTLAEGEGYVVDPTANSGTFTVSDGVVPATSPTVGVTATPTTLVEAEQTVVELTFTTDGAIPEGGLVVQLQGPPRAIAEFDVNATNPRLPEDETVVEGVVVTGGNIVGTDEVAGSLFLRITDPTATITVPVFDDGPGEGIETLNFTLVDGEAYEVDPAASALDITIDDVVVSNQPTDGDDTLAGTDGDDTIAGELGNDIIEGGDGDDVLRGDLNSRSPQDDVAGGNDIIFGGAGNDRIGGKAGNDILSGDEGDDLIYGDDGDDILMGVTGNDILVGDNFSDGSGSDLFVFGSGDGTDTVLDFEVGIDRIGIVEGEFTFADVTLTQDGTNTLLGISTTGETLAILNNVQASALGESDFAIVPDVSNPDQAIGLI
ncbi:MAG: calcium-binding protein, partial [Cyanobacteria bacterium P01_D01_bin.156]